MVGTGKVLPRPYPELIASPLPCPTAARVSAWPSSHCPCSSLEAPALGMGNPAKAGSSRKTHAVTSRGIRRVVEVVRRVLRTVRRR